MSCTTTRNALMRIPYACIITCDNIVICGTIIITDVFLTIQTEEYRERHHYISYRIIRARGNNNIYPNSSLLLIRYRFLNNIILVYKTKITSNNFCRRSTIARENHAQLYDIISIIFMLYVYINVYSVIKLFALFDARGRIKIFKLN